MKKYYASANFGCGTQYVCFNSQKERDNFVAFGTADLRRKKTYKEAKKHRYVFDCDKQKEIDLKERGAER